MRGRNSFPGFSYDPGGDTTRNNGNLITQTLTTDAARSQTYTYDPLNRLASANEAGGWAQTYAYDRFGNRAGAAGNGSRIRAGVREEKSRKRRRSSSR